MAGKPLHVCGGFLWEVSLWEAGGGVMGIFSYDLLHFPVVTSRGGGGGEWKPLFFIGDLSE